MFLREQLSSSGLDRTHLQKRAALIQSRQRARGRPARLGAASIYCKEITHMKVFLAALSAGFALASIAPPDAEAQGYRKKKAYKYYRSTHVARRPASIGHNGLCQRDTGTPTSQLNFRNRCDTEEFWNRMQEQGSRGRF
jgi:hypothetical protein